MSEAQALERLVLLTPIPPAPTGNGLAMRTELFRHAAAGAFEVQTVVVPVAGQLPAGVARSVESTHVALDPSRAKVGIMELLRDPAWRDRLGQVQKLPFFARHASPGLAGAVIEALDPDAPVTGIHVMRSYLAPLGLAVAERIGTRWATLDLDDDDVQYNSAAGDHDEANAYAHLLSVFGSGFDGVSAASGSEAAAISVRHGFHVESIPNAVEVPTELPRSRPKESAPSLLFVGNLHYRPNLDAAQLLVRELLPEIRRRCDDRTSLTIAGPSPGGLEGLAVPGVTLTGFVPDLAPLYAATDVVITPLRAGSGTRIKLLEAFAHEVPVVASEVAAAGLDVVSERHLLVAEDPAGYATAVERLMIEPGLADRLTRDARRLVLDHYSIDTVSRKIQRFFAAAAGG